VKFSRLFRWFPICAFIALSHTVQASEGTLVVTEDTILTEDHYGNIVIRGDKVTLDCDRHTVSGDRLTGDEKDIGIEVYEQRSVTVRDCRVNGFNTGILFLVCENCSAIGNKLKYNVTGLDIDTSPGSRIIKNAARYNEGSGIFCSESGGHRFEDNVMTSNGGHGLGLSNCLKSVLIQNYAKTNGLSGFHLRYLSIENVFWKNVSRKNNQSGFWIEWADDNLFVQNKASGNSYFDANIDTSEEPSRNNLFIGNDFKSTWQLERVIEHGG